MKTQKILALTVFLGLTGISCSKKKKEKEVNPIVTKVLPIVTPKTACTLDSKKAHTTQVFGSLTQEAFSKKIYSLIGRNIRTTTQVVVHQGNLSKITPASAGKKATTTAIPLQPNLFDTALCNSTVVGPITQLDNVIKKTLSNPVVAFKSLGARAPGTLYFVSGFFATSTDIKTKTKGRLLTSAAGRCETHTYLKLDSVKVNSANKAHTLTFKALNLSEIKALNLPKNANCSGSSDYFKENQTVSVEAFFSINLKTKKEALYLQNVGSKNSFSIFELN